MKKLEIRINENGAMKHETSGFEGDSCLAVGNEFKNNLKKNGINQGDSELIMKENEIISENSEKETESLY